MMTSIEQNVSNFVLAQIQNMQQAQPVQSFPTQISAAQLQELQKQELIAVLRLQQQQKIAELQQRLQLEQLQQQLQQQLTMLHLEQLQAMQAGVPQTLPATSVTSPTTLAPATPMGVIAPPPGLEPLPTKATPPPRRGQPEFTRLFKKQGDADPSEALTESGTSSDDESSQSQHSSSTSSAATTTPASPGAAPVSTRARTLVAGKFPRSVSDETLGDAFRTIVGRGNVNVCRIIREKSGRSLCYAFVEFVDLASTEKAFEACGKGELVLLDEENNAWHVTASHARRARAAAKQGSQAAEPACEFKMRI